MRILTDEDIKKSRSHFFNKSKKTTVINKGDKRVNGSRMCTICGEELSAVMMSTGDSQATKKHYHCVFSDLFFVSICWDIRSCYTKMNQMRGERV